MAIPKTIHYCWLGGNPKPKSVLKCIESWKKLCPDYEIIEWNEDNLNISSHLYSKQAYDMKAWAFATDYFRLWVVYTHGGIYLDTDVQIIKSFDPLLENKGFMGFESEDIVASGLGFGAEAGNRFLAENMKVYESLAFINSDGTLNRRPAPEYTTEIAKAYGLTGDTGKPQSVLDMTFYPKAYFAPKDYFTGRLQVTKNTYSIHHYDSSWFTGAEQKQRKHDLWDARIRAITYIPRVIVKRILGEQRYKHMAAGMKGKLSKGKNNE